jgi:VanZ family protein
LRRSPAARFIPGVFVGRTARQRWILVGAWMALIFYGSTDLLSQNRTLRILGPLLRWLKPEITPEEIHAVQVFVRKSGHVTEFAVLAVLVWWALRKASGRFRDGWNLPAVALAWGITTAYAVTDEVHQAFVPTRTGDVVDVLIDSVGAAFGLWLAWAVGRCRNRW